MLSGFEKPGHALSVLQVIVTAPVQSFGPSLKNHFLVMILRIRLNDWGLMPK